MRESRTRSGFTRPLIVAVACFCTAVIAASGGAAASWRKMQGGRGDEREAAQGRLKPPTGLSCDRNHTTSFTGLITAYSRSARRIQVRVRTDEQTTEQFTIPLSRGEDASKKFLLKGEPFRAGDWKKIERGRGLLKPRMRAIIWACRDENDDFHAELIDWRPDEGQGSFVL